MRKYSIHVFLSALIVFPYPSIKSAGRMTGHSNTPAIACAENSLLHSVSNSSPVQSIPAPPSSNTMNHLLSGQEDYILSFDRERSLAGALAFLAQTEDDPNHIPAVCVKQNLELGSLNVLLAINKTKWCDGDTILQNLKQHFQRLFSVLSTFSDSTSLSVHLMP